MTEQLDYSSQKDFYDPSKHGGSVTVIGAGGIGSPTIMGLARLGVPNINVFDDDEVESRNVVSQNYRKYDIGKPKAEIISALAEEVANCKVNSFKRRIVSDDTLTGDIIISAVDSMESRKNIFDAAIKSPSVKYLIDGRLGGELIVCYAIDIRNKEHTDYYTSDEIMFSDDESVSNICTARAVCDVGFAVAAIIVRSVRRILTDQPVQKLAMLNMASLRLDTYE